MFRVSAAKSVVSKGYLPENLANVKTVDSWTYLENRVGKNKLETWQVMCLFNKHKNLVFIFINIY